MNSIIIVLSVFVVIGFFTIITVYENTQTQYFTNENSYLYIVGEKKYHDMVYKRYSSRRVKDNNIDGKECEAVAEYYKNASLYKMYDEVGDKEKVEKYQEKMSQSAKEMGTMNFTEEEILVSLGISN